MHFFLYKEHTQVWRRQELWIEDELNDISSRYIPHTTPRYILSRQIKYLDIVVPFESKKVLWELKCVVKSCGTDALPLKRASQHIWDLSQIRQHSPLSRGWSSQWPVSQLLSDFVRLIQSTKFPNPFNDQILPHPWQKTNLETVATCTDAALAREESIIVGSSSHLWVITRDPGDPGAQKLIITSSHSSPSFFCLVLRPAPLCRAHREEVRVGLAATSLHPSTRLFLNFATLCFTSHTPSCPCHLTQDEPNSYLPK